MSPISLILYFDLQTDEKWLSFSHFKIFPYAGQACFCVVVVLTEVGNELKQPKTI